MPRPRSYTYLLGDSSTEASRLRAQARLWDPTAHALFDRLKIRAGALHTSGLELVDVAPTVKSGHPGSPVWNWLSAYFLGGVVDRLAGLAAFTRADARQLTRDWRAASKEPQSLLIGPALIDVVGRRSKRSGRSKQSN